MNEEKKEYYRLYLNNARIIEDKGEKKEGCLRAKPRAKSDNISKDISRPFLVIAEMQKDGFIDIISGKEIKYDDGLVSRGNFGFVDTSKYDVLTKTKEEEYLSFLNSVDEETLNTYDEEASTILVYFKEELTCFAYEKMNKKEIVSELKDLDDPDVVSAYMEELKKIETGSVAREKAEMYLDLRKKAIDDKYLEDDYYADRYIDVFRGRYKKMTK